MKKGHMMEIPMKTMGLAQAEALKHKMSSRAQELKDTKRSDQHTINVQGLFRQSSNVNFQSHAQALLNKYKNSPVIKARIQKAKELRNAGITPQQRKEKQTKIQSDTKKTANAPAGLCVEEINRGVGNPFTEPCWIEGIKGKMDPLLRQVEEGAWLCGKDALGPHQVVHTEAAKLMASKALSGKQLGPNDRRGILVYANTGSGKTVSATGIMAAFWKTNLKIFFVTSNENAKNNPLTEYAKNALIFFGKEYAKIMFSKCSYMPPEKFWNTAAYKNQQLTFPGPDGEPRSFKQWCVEEGQQVISKRLQGGKILSFWVFAGAGKADKIDKLKTEGAVLIIDESQNMYKPRNKGAESEALGYMAKHLQTEAYMKKSYIFPLTATPGDTAGQVMSMVNVVRPWGMPVVTPQAFVANPSIIRGLVSYADIRGDQTHYGHLSGPDHQPINKYVNFEPRYFAALLAEMKGYKEATNLNSNPEDSKKFYIKSMIGSCILGAKKVKDLYKGDEAAFEKLLSAKINGRTEVVFSSKMEAIFKAIENTKGCQYLYVPDPNVLKATVDVMQSRLGYERITGDQKYLKQVSKGSKKSWEIDADLGEKKRFYAFYPGTMDGVPGDADQMKSVLDFFKSSKNKYGERIKLFVGTVFEGLDMGWLQAVHLAAPLPSTADDDQAVGRALRYCGHDPHAREVAVYRYFGVAPKSLEGLNAKPAKQKAIDQGLEMLSEKNERGVNMHVYRDALRRGKPMRDFMMCIRGVSIECEANAEHGGILAAAQYGEKTQCHPKRCDVQLDAKGNLVVEKHKAGTHKNKNKIPQKGLVKSPQKNTPLSQSDKHRLLKNHVLQNHPKNHLVHPQTHQLKQRHVAGLSRVGQLGPQPKHAGQNHTKHTGVTGLSRVGQLGPQPKRIDQHTTTRGTSSSWGDVFRRILGGQPKRYSGRMTSA